MSSFGQRSKSSYNLSMSQEYIPTIGLEIHAELGTRTKMFCDSLNDPDEQRPNVNVCPVCLAHPGALPTINKEAVASVIKVGLALNGRISAESKFDRKNYFYPDLPKGYQISQYDMPLVLGGELLGVHLTRIHLEEDTANLLHEGGDTLVDFNRAGVPLMELVTEPDIHDAETAVRFAKELQLILRYLGVSHANMDKGQMRVEVNISLAKEGQPLGTKVEVKNINSFKAVEGAIAFEIKRQTEALTNGTPLVQETRGWDDIKRVTVSQRSKESAKDYRYFPEPDLPPFETAAFGLEDIKARLPELPEGKRIRLAGEYGLSREQASMLVEEPVLARFYEEAASELAERESEDKDGKASRARAQQLLFNYLTSDLRGIMTAQKTGFKDLSITPENFAELIDMVADQEITSRQAKNVLVIMFADGGDPSTIIRERGLGTISDTGEIELAVRDVIGANPQAVADYRKGKENSVKFLMGQAMRQLQGRGEPKVLEEVIVKVLKEN